jgi:hypothetical protein
MLFNLELFNSNTRYISENSDYKSINVKKKFFIKQKKKSMIFWNSYKESFRYFI